MPAINFDAYNHQNAAPGGPLACIALSNTPSTTVGIGPLATGGTGGAGAGATTSYPGGTGAGTSAVDSLGYRPNDTRGSFILTAAGTPVAGLIAQVNFAQPYAGPVGSVAVTCVDTTASPAVAVPVSAVLSTSAPGSTTGFQVASSGTALTAAHAYLITYQVEP
jgi:hypothetical protein